MKKHYQSPTIKVVEFKVERGFEGSSQGLSLNTAGTEFQMDFDDYGPRETEYSFTDYGNNFFGN